MAHEPAETMRKAPESVSATSEIQRSAETKVRTTAAAMARTERRIRATPMTMKLRTSNASQTAVEVSFFETHIQIRVSGSRGRKLGNRERALSGSFLAGQTAKPA